MIGLVGLDHLTAPAEVRGRLSFTGERLAAALRALAGAPAVAGVALLSTCNRTEVYVAAGDWPAARAAVERYLLAAYRLGPAASLAEVPDAAPDVAADAGRRVAAAGDAGGPGRLAALAGGRAAVADEAPALYHAEGGDAARHLFGVAAGLRSLLVGEAQVLGQVKAALAAAEAAGSVDDDLRALFIAAIQVGKRARTETRIGQVDRSLAAVAVRVAGDSLGGLAGMAALVVGAGRTSHLCARRLRAAGVGRLVLANRSAQAAARLATELDGETVGLDEVGEAIAGVDLIISATAAPHPVLTAAKVAHGLRGRRAPLVVVDMAVPADVEAAVGLLPAVSLYTLDQLREVAGEDDLRAADLARAEGMVEEGARQWAQARRVRQAVPGIAALRRHVDRSQEAELARTLAQLGHLDEADRAAVARFGQRLVDKMFHHLVARIRALAEYDEVPPDVTMRVLAQLFADPDAPDAGR